MTTKELSIRYFEFVWKADRVSGVRRDRELMVERQLEGRGIRDERVLKAFRIVPREAFLPPGLRRGAYGDFPLPICQDQTISQPYIVAYMVEQLEIMPGDRVLEIGTGSGYETAILMRLSDHVYSVEIRQELHKTAAQRLRELGYKNTQLRLGDGGDGWAEEAPFDKIIASAAVACIPEAWKSQLAAEGRLIAPVGGELQRLYLGRKEAGRWAEEPLIAVKFVPMCAAKKSFLGHKRHPGEHHG